MAWGDKGHSTQGGMTYNPSTADWDFTPSGTGSNSDSGGRDVAFFTDQGRPVYTNPAPVNQVAAGQVQTGPGGGGSGPGAGGVATGPDGGGNGPGSKAVATVGNRGAFLSGLTVSVPQRGKDQGTVFADDPGPWLDMWEIAPATPLMMAGHAVKHDRGWSDASQWEERYGEPGDWLGGGVMMGVDVTHNVGSVLSPYWDAFQEDRLFAPGWGGIVDLGPFKPDGVAKRGGF